jgi:hypothetical protein
MEGIVIPALILGPRLELRKIKGLARMPKFNGQSDLDNARLLKPEHRRKAVSPGAFGTWKFGSIVSSTKTPSAVIA